MLISKYVEIGIGSANYKYYEEKGYEIPRRYNKAKKKWQFKRGEKIKVKVEDLLISRVFVRVRCDECGVENEILYQGYLNNVHEDGKTYCLKCASRIFNGGSNSYRWNESLTEEERLIINTKSRTKNVDGYSEFKRAVMKRDHYMCVVCGSKKELHVHHLNSFSSDKDNRINPENGVCLCEDCHIRFHSIYGKNDNTKEQFEDFTHIFDKDYSCDFSLSSLRKVVLLNTGEIYNTVKECAEDLGIDGRRIYEVCNHVKYSVNDYHFMFLEEYENTPKNQLHKAYTYQWRNSFGQGANKKVRCVTTNELFDCISDACEKYLGSRKNDGRIAMCCDGKRKYVGKLADGTKLVWEWIK